MSTPKLTVGIPTFNRAAWLRETIESVLAQTFTDFRLIVSDNASEDDTPDVVRSFSDERIDYVRSERNIGGPANENRLIGLADAEYLMILPDDDLLYPGHLGAAVDLLERFVTVGLVHTAFDVIDAQSQVVQSVEPIASRSPVMIERNDRALERLMVSTWPICFSSVVYRTQAIVEAGGLRAEEGHFRDLQLWMRIALDWDFGYVATPLTGFRIHGSSATSTIAAAEGAASDEREADLMQTQMRFERRMSFLDRAPLEPSKRKRLRALATLHRTVEQASLGLPWTAVAARVVKVVRTYPRVLLHPVLWRHVVAPLRSMPLLSALRGALRGQRRGKD